MRVLGQCYDGGAEPGRHSDGPGEQYLLQFGAFDANEGPHVPPQPFQVGLAEHLSLLVTKVPVADNRPGLLDGCTHAERAQDADAIRLHGDAGPHGVPRWATLNELRREAVLVQSRGQGKAGDSSADDQDSFNVGHLLLLSAPIRSPTFSNGAVE